MPCTYSRINLHIVFRVKPQRQVILPRFESKLHGYISGILKGEGVLVIAINGMPDHLHILCRFLPRHYIPDMLRRIKGSSSKWINATCGCPGKFNWQIGYSVFSVSEFGVRNVKKYISFQKQHHQSLNVDIELQRLLKNHNIPWDSDGFE